MHRSTFFAAFVCLCTAGFLVISGCSSSPVILTDDGGDDAAEQGDGRGADAHLEAGGDHAVGAEAAAETGVAMDSSVADASDATVGHDASSSDGDAEGVDAADTGAEAEAAADGATDGATDKCAGVHCTASDACHDVGTCDPATGNCSNPVLPDGTACDDANACTSGDVCQAGTCTGSPSVTCTASDACHVAGTCDPGTGKCSNPTAPNGTSCNDGNKCTQNDTCQDGTCTAGASVTCTAIDPCHLAGTCDPASGACSNPPKNALTCGAVDQCHTAGACDPTTGACTTPAAANGAACDDGNECTQTDSCQAGVCTGGNPVVCAASDTCHVAGTCNATTGRCTNPAQPDGTACTDGNACTQGDTCVAGTCTGRPVVCTALDQCHLAGTCNTATGVCSNLVRTDGAACTDGNACTQTDTCQSGTCTGTNPAMCEASDQCHLAGTCNPGTGECSNPPAPNGTMCSDGNACTQTDTCQTGVCTGGNPVTCTASDQCHVAGTCNPASGTCSNPAATNGTSCNDGDFCTQTDTCQAGVCTGSNPVTCTAPDQCHLPGTCSPATGTCSNVMAPPGFPCNDGNACTSLDQCVAGTCIGIIPTICTPQDQCHTAGTCNPSTGMCTNPTASDGTSCSDGNACTQTDSCQSGICTGGNPVTCTAADQCHLAGTCDPSNGTCTNPTASDGASCNDGNACTSSDVCTSGVCAGTSFSCTPTECQSSSTCDGAGGCNITNAMSGTACTDDGNPCTSDTCDGSGNCAHPSAGDGTSCGSGLECGSGNCVPIPTVVATSPADGDTPVAGVTISVTFSVAMDATTLTAQTTAGSCSGSVQVILDDGSCISFASASPVMSGGNTVATFTAAPGLLVNRGYKTKVTTSAKSAAAGPLASDFTMTTGYSTVSPAAPAVEDGAGAPAEVDACVLLSSTASGNPGDMVNMFGRIFESGVTGTGTGSPAIDAQFGFAPANGDGSPQSNPEYEGAWTWAGATFSASVGGQDDDYFDTLTLPASGVYNYAYRFSLDGGVSWTYCSSNASGAQFGNFDLGALGVLTVN